MFESLALIEKAASLYALQNKEHDEEDNLRFQSMALYYIKHAFLMTTFSHEAAANALIYSIDCSNLLRERADTLSVPAKCEFFCITRGKKLDLGNNIHEKFSNIIKTRNSLVHPKPRKIPMVETNDGTDYEFDKNIKTPPHHFYMFLDLNYSLDSIASTLRYFSWILFDTCKLNISEGSTLIGAGTCGFIGPAKRLATQYDWDFRTFGLRRRKI